MVSTDGSQSVKEDKILEKMEKLTEHCYRLVKAVFDDQQTSAVNVMKYINDSKIEVTFITDEDMKEQIRIEHMQKVMLAMSDVKRNHLIGEGYEVVIKQLIPLMKENFQRMSKISLEKVVVILRQFATYFMFVGDYTRACNILLFILFVKSNDHMAKMALLKIVTSTNDLHFMRKVVQICEKEDGLKNPGVDTKYVFKAYRLLYLAKVATKDEGRQSLVKEILAFEAELNSKKPRSVSGYEALISLSLAKIALISSKHGNKLGLDSIGTIKTYIVEKLMASVLFHYNKGTFINDNPILFDMQMKSDHFVAYISTLALYFDLVDQSICDYRDSGDMKQAMSFFTLALSYSLRSGCKERLAISMNTGSILNNYVRRSKVMGLLHALVLFEHSSREKSAPLKALENERIHATRSRSKETITEEIVSNRKICTALEEISQTTGSNILFHAYDCGCVSCSKLSRSPKTKLSRIHAVFILEQLSETISDTSSLMAYFADFQTISQEFMVLWNEMRMKIGTPKSSDGTIEDTTISMQILNAITLVVARNFSNIETDRVKLLLDFAKLYTKKQYDIFFKYKLFFIVLAVKISYRSFMILPCYCYLSDETGMVNLLNNFDKVSISRNNTDVSKLAFESKTQKEKTDVILKSLNDNTLDASINLKSEMKLRQNNNKYTFRTVKSSLTTANKEAMNGTVISLMALFEENIHCKDVEWKRALFTLILRLSLFTTIDKWKLAWIVAESNNTIFSASHAKNSAKENTKLEFKDADHFKNQILKLASKDVTITRLIVDDENVLWMMKLHQSHDPLIVPCKKLSSNYFNVRLLNYHTVHDNLTKEAGLTTGNFFWAVRHGLEETLKHLSTTIEKELFGPLQYLILPYKVCEGTSIKKFIDAMEKGKFPEEVASSLAIASVFVDATIWADLIKCLSELYEPVKSNFISQAIQRHEIISKSLFELYKRNKMLPEKYDAILKECDAGSMCDGKSITILILDADMTLYPWEMMEVFKFSPMVCRSTSLSTFVNRYGGQDDARCIDTDKSYYVIDPKGDLPETRNWMLDKLKTIKWEGVSCEYPKPETILSIAENKDAFVYIGHGNGRKMYKQALKERKFNAVAFLMGCSSVKMGLSRNSYFYSDFVDQYFTSKGPAVVGCAWLVTDREINKYFDYIFENSFKLNTSIEGKPNEKKSLTSLLSLLVNARKHVRLQYLTAASVIVYGIPLSM
uniref:Separase n=1 Tax=Rhabditophanes sp. KR3021 TaxID=114890 RepID=A0AC35UCY2_9BILA